jgi:hypothetical protein
MLKKELEGLIRSASVEFLEEQHLYRNKETGEFYTGCTTISDAWDKSFFLGPWHAKEMALEILSQPFDVIKGLTPPEFEKFITDAKGAAKRKSEKAKVDGTAAHDYAEQFIGSKIDPSRDLPLSPEGKEALSAVNAFHGWQKDKDIQWLAAELVVASDIYRIAGKLDGLAIVDGIPSLIDFKTSNQLSASYLLQCAGYDIMLEEMGFPVRQYIIVRIPKDGTDAETLTIRDRDEIKFLKETFLHQREAHKFYVYAENKLKDEAHKMKVDLPSFTETPKTPKVGSKKKAA